MTLDDMNALQEVVRYLRCQADTLQTQIEEELEVIKEAQLHLQTIENLEPEDRKIFSPRSMDVYKEKIQMTRTEKSFHEDRNKVLLERKAVLDNQITKLETVLQHQQREISAEKKRIQKQFQVFWKKLEEIISRIEKSSASIDRNPIQARQDFVIIAKTLQEAVENMKKNAG
nr:hypothetical protein [uncultured Acetatifactor sp.]